MAGYFTSDPNAVWSVVVPVVLALYYLAVIYWLRQPSQRGTVVTQYSPPSGMSPGEMRYVLTGEFDEKVVVAAVVHLAAQGLVRFDGLDKYYAVCKTSAVPPSDLPPDELAVYRTMFNLDEAGAQPFPGRLRTYNELPHDSFLLPLPGEKNFVLLSEAIRRALRAGTDPKYFTSNIRFIAPAAMLSLFAVFVRVHDPVIALLFAAAVTLGGLALNVSERVFLFGINEKPMPGNTAAMRLLFFFACMGALGAFGAGSPAFLISLGVVLWLNLLFAPKLRARTPLGAERAHQVEGYREFLKQVELDRMARMKSPDWLPNPSTKYLAYALALDIGNAWEEYLAHSGCEVLVVQREKKGVFPQRVRLREPDTTVDAFLGFALAILMVSGAVFLIGSMMGTLDLPSSQLPAGTLAFLYGIVFFVLVAALVVRSRRP